MLVGAFIVAILWWLLTGDCFQFVIVIAAAVAVGVIAAHVNKGGNR